MIAAMGQACGMAKLLLTVQVPNPFQVLPFLCWSLAKQQRVSAQASVALDTELAIRWRETQLSRRARGKELQVPGVVSRVADAAGSGMIAMRRRASIGLGLPGWGMGAGEYMPKKQRHDP